MFDFFQSLNAIYFIPLLAIIMVGMFNRTVNHRSALVTVLVGLGLTIVGILLPSGVEWSIKIFGSKYHYVGAVFAFLVVLQLVLGSIGMRRDTPYVQQDVGAVDLTPWRHAKWVGGLLVAFSLAVYVYFAF